MSGTLMTGCQLMIIGMSVVYLFIVVLIWAMKLTSKIITLINKYYPEESNEPKIKTKIKDDAEIAIALALIAEESRK